jgi:hypothetical protein
MWFNRAKALKIVTVKDQTVAKVPAWIDVDGRRVHTEKLGVRFAGDGLLFWPEEGGDRYRSALDGSKGRHITLAPPNAGAPPAASSSAGPAASANKPRPSQFVLSSRGVFRLSEEEGAVVLSSLNGKPGEIEPIAKLEGPLAAFSEWILDAAEERLAFAILSDTSRDGVLDEEEDSAEVFVTDAAPGSLSFGRAPVTLLADELKPKIAAAAGVPEASVSSLHDAGGALEVTADLPWIEGEKAKALLDRALVAARAISLQVTSLDPSINLRVGPLHLKVHRPSKDADGRPHVALMARGILVDDREAIPLVLHKPTRTTITSFSSATMVMLSGELENTGKTTTSPIEAFMVPSGAPAAPFSFSFPPQRLEVFRQHLGGIEPGKRASFSLTGNLSGGWVGPKFRSDGGKRVKVFNQYTYDHAVGWLDTALAIRAGHGVWSEHGDELVDAHQRRVLVHLTAEQAALPEAARDALFRTIAKALRGHHEKFHGGQENYPLRVTFEAPGGGGWRMGEGKEIDRFEGKEEPSPKP